MLNVQNLEVKNVIYMSKEEIKIEIQAIKSALQVIKVSNVKIDVMNDKKAKRLRVLETELTDRNFNNIK